MLNRLGDILVPGHILTEAEASALAALTLPPSLARRRALAARNDAILAALPATGETAPTDAACALQRALRRRAAGQGVTPPELAAAADLVLAANDGSPLSWKTIAAIERAARIEAEGP